MYEQLSIFDIVPIKKTIEENQCLNEPCASCDIRWGSIKCFIRRGYIWDTVHRFAKDESGKPIRKSVENRECKKIYAGEV